MTDLVLPTNIPWDDLTQELLEETVFWLLDSFGAKDLVWRIGTTRGHSTDGGRDLEVTFHQTTPSGDVRTEHWWVQCKGTSGSVDRTTVQYFVQDTEGHDPDYAVVVTNARFTNPTTDWARNHNDAHIRPSVILWDRDFLERQLIKHPEVVLRTTPKALSPQGRLQASSSRFWNQMYLAPSSDLIGIWQTKDEIEWDAQALAAVLASELANGNVSDHPWAAWATEDSLKDTCVVLLANSLFLNVRASGMGVPGNVINDALLYAALAAIDRLDIDVATRLLGEPLSFTDHEEEDETDLPAALSEFILDPLVRHLEAVLGDLCSQDCSRVDAPLLALAEKSATSKYWDRLIFDPTAGDSDNESEDDRHLIFQMHDRPCTIGLVEGSSSCPLYFDQEGQLASKLPAFRSVIHSRKGLRISERDL